jgi:integrase
MTGHIRRRGERSWELKFDIGRDERTGKRIIQYHSFKGTKKEAHVKLAELIASVAKGSYVSRSHITVTEHVTARIDQWVALDEITPKTAERYRELLTNQIAPHIGPKALQKLKPLDIELWHARLKTSGRKDGQGGLSARTIRHAHRLLSKALREAMGNDLVVRNVAQTKKPPKVNDDEEVQIVEEHQLKTLLVKLAGRAMYPKAVLSLFAGLRRGELLALRWHHIDLERKVLQVREALEETKAHGVQVKAPKSMAGHREITLPDIVVEALRDHRRQQLEMRVSLGLGKPPDDALLFPKLDSSPQSPRAFSKEWSDVAASIGMPEITFHALRHTHASQLIDAGVDIVTIAKRLGHSSPNITLKVYAHVFKQKDDKSSAAINAAVAALLD